MSPSTERNIELDFDRLTGYVDAVLAAAVDTSSPDVATWRELLFGWMVRLVEEAQTGNLPIRRAGALLVGQLAKELERPDLWKVHIKHAHRLDSLTRYSAFSA